MGFAEEMEQRFGDLIGNIADDYRDVFLWEGFEDVAGQEGGVWDFLESGKELGVEFGYEEMSCFF